MKSTQQAIDRLLASARATTPSSPAGNDALEALSPGLAVRIAARWSAPSDKLGALQVWERLTAASLALSLVVFTTVVLVNTQRSAGSEPDTMLSLFLARPAPVDDFPF